MEYLNKVLGIRVVYKDEASFSMPNFIHARYRLQLVTLDGETAVFVYPKGELEAVSAVSRHLEKISNTEPNENTIKSSKKKQSLFKTIVYDYFKCIKFDEYYSFNSEIKSYCCKICSDNKYFKEKHNIERHLKEQHFYTKEICKDCGKSYLRFA